MNKDAKIRALYILKALYELTDEDHFLTTTEIAKMLQERYGLNVYRTTIGSDVEQLRQLGFDIRVNRSTQNCYSLVGRLFDLSELKLLIDAVETSKLITESKSKALVEKLGTLSSYTKSTELKRNLCIAGRAKPISEQIYYIVDALNKAINEGKKVSFQYYQYNVRKERKLRHDGEIYVFSPYTLVWNGDHYYTVGYSEKHKEIRSFRVDRIYEQPKMLKETAAAKPDGFNETEYVKTMICMNGARPQTVELICENSVMDAMIDHFGEDVCTYAYNLTSFKAVVNVAPSQTFYGWVFGFCGKIMIAGPENVKTEYENMVRKASTFLQE